MKCIVRAISSLLLFLSALLSGCNANSGMMAATFTPAPVPSSAENLGELLDQAAGQVPFALLIPDESKLPFGIKLVGLEFVPGMKTQPFVIMQSYRVQGSVVVITQTSEVGQIPAKAIGQTPLRGLVGYWVVLSAGDRLLYWEENGCSMTINGKLTDKETLFLAEALVPYHSSAKPVETRHP